MTASDRITMLSILDLTVTLSPDGSHLLAVGSDILLQAAEATLRQHSAELLAYLRTQPHEGSYSPERRNAHEHS